MVKSFQIICAISLTIIALSSSYYFVIRPIQKDQPLKECLKTAEDVIVLMKKVGEENPGAKAASPIKILEAEKAKEDCYKKY